MEHFLKKEGCVSDGLSKPPRRSWRRRWLSRRRTSRSTLCHADVW